MCIIVVRICFVVIIGVGIIVGVWVCFVVIVSVVVVVIFGVVIDWLGVFCIF